MERLNGENLKEVDPPEKWTHQYLASYESTARTVARGAWFFDFIEFIIREYVYKRDKSMVQICKDSYNDNLSKYHNWFLRHAANLAINLANSREAFNELLCAE